MSGSSCADIRGSLPSCSSRGTLRRPTSSLSASAGNPARALALRRTPSKRRCRGEGRPRRSIQGRGRRRKARPRSTYRHEGRVKIAHLDEQPVQGGLIGRSQLVLGLPAAGLRTDRLLTHYDCSFNSLSLLSATDTGGLSFRSWLQILCACRTARRRSRLVRSRFSRCRNCASRRSSSLRAFTRCQSKSIITFALPFSLLFVQRLGPISS